MRWGEEEADRERASEQVKKRRQTLMPFNFIEHSIAC